jgi:hypothetical protein
MRIRVEYNEDLRERIQPPEDTAPEFHSCSSVTIIITVNQRHFNGSKSEINHEDVPRIRVGTDIREESFTLIETRCSSVASG